VGLRLSAELRIQDPFALVGVVAAEGIAIAPSSPGLAAELDALVARRAAEDFPPQRIKEGIRGLLRRGGFKPAGRNKPASEYLAQAAREGRFPRINGPVDVNNLVSLETGIPISLLDLDAFSTGGESKLVLRYGLPGESYVFNSGGQEIDLAGLLCACSEGEALGNACKDSMRGKLKEATTRVVAVLYGSSEIFLPGGMAPIGPSMELICARFGDLLAAHCGAASARFLVLRKDSPAGLLEL
jgi:DNA/RNA-binding domain of Phe-tRNA-synthetase-like protein